MSIKEKELEIIEEFEMFDDWMDKYDYLIGLGKDLPLIPEQFKTESYLISGCQSNAWVKADLIDGKVVYQGDGDAIITKGVMAVLFRVLSNQTPKDVIEADLSFLDKIGLREHLSPTRANGLLSTVKMMKFYAVALNAKLENQNS